MSLFRFSVGNYRSINNVVTLDMAPALGSATMLSAPAQDLTQPVTAIFGPNASGKSNFLDAMYFALRAIFSSATSWRDESDYPTPPYFPFVLDDATLNEPSFFEFDFTIDNTRYLYGFTYGSDGVIEEWLSYVPKQRWSKCFIRNTSDNTEFDWNNAFLNRTTQRELGKIDKRELVLSVALRDKHSILGKIAEALTSSFNFLPLGDSAQNARIEQLTSLIHKRHFDLDEISLLMQAADTGIDSVSIDKTKVPQHIVDKMNRIITAINNASDEINNIALSNDEVESVVYNLVFTHKGKNQSRTLTMQEESAGTLAWLSIAPQLLQSLRKGTILIADELDSSLHQNLIEMIIRCFTDRSINQHGAQLILTTHNTNIIEHMEALALEPATMWFIEKNLHGESSLFSLADFPNRPEANYERRYLGGRYGALPQLSPSTLRGLVSQES